MKNKILSLMVFLGCLTGSTVSFADDSIFIDDCVPMDSQTAIQNNMMFESFNASLSCEDVSRIKNLSFYTSAILGVPALAYASASESAKLALLAALGLSTPAVLAISVLTASGSIVYYMVLNKKLEDCKKLDEQALNQKLMEELERKYGLKPTPGVQVQFQK